MQPRLSPSGTYITTSVGGERVQAFVPGQLPPGLNLDSLNLRLERANRALGRLDGASSLRPS